MKYIKWMKSMMFGGFMAIITASTVGADISVCTLTFNKALERDIPFTLHLEILNGKINKAFATSPLNMMYHDADISGLEIEGNVISGELKIIIHSNRRDTAGGRWLSSHAQPVNCIYSVDGRISDGLITGKYTGRYGKIDKNGDFAGEISPGYEMSKCPRIAISMENAITRSYIEASPITSRLLVRFVVQEGKAHIVGSTETEGGLTSSYFISRMEGIDMYLSGGKLHGTMQVRVLLSSRHDKREDRVMSHDPRVITEIKEALGLYEYSLDGMVIGKTIAGSFTARQDGREITGSRFIGQIIDDAPLRPGEADYAIIMACAVTDGRPLNLYLLAEKGKFVYGYGLTPGYYSTVHDLDFSGLKLAHDKLSGELKVTIEPDGWSDPQPVTCLYQIDADIIGNSVEGKFNGIFDNEKVKGTLSGELRPPVEAAKINQLFLHFEDGLMGGEPTENRVFINITLKDGKLKDGYVFNNHTTVKGDVTSLEYILDGSSVHCEMTAIVSDGCVWPGEYHFVINGRFLAGRLFLGKFESQYTSAIGNRFIKNGKFDGTADHINFLPNTPANIRPAPANTGPTRASSAKYRPL